MIKENICEFLNVFQFFAACPQAKNFKQMKQSKNSFCLDNRSILDLHHFILQFATLFEIEGKDVNWQHYLLQDISFRLAQLLSKQPDAVNAKEYVGFVKENEQHFKKRTEEEDVDELVITIYRDLKDLIEKSLTQETSLEKLKTFFQQVQVNLLSHYKESLYSYSNHAPDIGLLFSFIQLIHKYLISDLNQLPQKLTEFYYETIINKKRLPALPDRAFVYFEAASSVKSAVLESGIALYAGRDASNNQVIFETQDSLRLSQAKLIDIRTLHFTPSTDGKEAINDKQGIFKKHCFQGEQYHKFETFGKNVALYKEPEKDEIADFGFAIASKLLYLKEGKREIDIILPNFSLDENLLEHYQFSITTKEGWQDLTEKNIKFSPENQNAQINIELDKSFEPIEPYLDFADTPAIRCTLKLESKTRTADYDRLKNLEINLNEIEIKVNVDGIQNLKCYNDTGILNINQPFQPFGASPKKYSKFIIGNAEAFQKNVSVINVQLDWNLPEWNLAEYFEAYKEEDEEIGDRSAYKVKLNVVNDLIPLFLENQNEEKHLVNIKIETKGNNKKTFQTPQEWNTDLPEYNKDLKWGYLVMQIASPSYPFGTQLYQRTLAKRSDAMIKSIINSQGGASISMNVNPPIIPELRGIQLGYSAKEKGKQTFYHIHPFGSELVKRNKSTFVTQKYLATIETGKKNYQGLLFLGIKNLSAGLLSIYFELAGSSLLPSSSETNVETPQFFLLQNNTFSPIAKVSDSTEGFEQSGVIQLNIETNTLDYTHNSILPSTELHWIIVAVSESAESFGITNQIHLHGLEAVSTSSNIRDNTNKITRTLKDVPIIKKVFQASGFLQGRQREVDVAFNKRLASEIRHRQRPSKVKDIKEIIYHQFPEIAHCLVFPENDILKVVAIPQKKSNITRPSFPISFLIKVRDFLINNISTFLEIVVENPHYAVLQTHSYFRSKSKSSTIQWKQLEEKIKKGFIETYFNPWAGKYLSFGTTPDILKIKSEIEQKENLVLEDLIFYYYWLEKDERRFAKITDFQSKIDLKSNLILIFDDGPEQNYKHHSLFFDTQKENWELRKGKLSKKEKDQQGMIIGFKENMYFHLGN